MVSQNLNKDQLEQKVEWLDAERRTAQDTIADLEKRLAALEKATIKEGVSSKAVSGHTTRIDNLSKQLDEFEKKLTTFQTESKTELQTLEKQNKQQEKSLEQDQKG